MKQESDIHEIHARLLELLNQSGLEMATKWGAPVYTTKGKNVVGVMKFKRHAALWFFNGAYLSDPLKVLITASEGKTQNMRHWKFYTLEDLSNEDILKYVAEATSQVEEGKMVKIQRSSEFTVPEELKNAMAVNPDLYKAFYALSHACQREYAQHIGEAQKAETRIRRLEKMIPMILESKGMNEQYRKNTKE